MGFVGGFPPALFSAVILAPELREASRVTSPRPADMPLIRKIICTSVMLHPRLVFSTIPRRCDRETAAKSTARNGFDANPET